jgi:hypothetical protein
MGAISSSVLLLSSSFPPHIVIFEMVISLHGSVGIIQIRARIWNSIEFQKVSLI